MRTLFTSILLFACALSTFSHAPVFAFSKDYDGTRLLPDKIGEARAVSAPSVSPINPEDKKPAEGIEVTVSRTYLLTDGKKFKVELIKTRTDKDAYSLYSASANKLSSEVSKQDEVATASLLTSSGRFLFYKGLSFVSIIDESTSPNAEALTAFAKLLAEPLDNGEGEIPVLVKHLPEWETVRHRAVYALGLPALQMAAGNRPALEAVSFSGGLDAVTAPYGASRLVIIEHPTPQLASDNDARIKARINELKGSRQSVPTAYQRVGNYAVFVFDAPDEATALQLVERVDYEQVVQWLGNNPRLLERAQREYSETTAGVILAVVKASGLSLLVCLGIGGIFGSIVFRRRRAQQSMNEAYSDAGGMLRLNLDEVTQKVAPSRLLGKGDR